MMTLKLVLPLLILVCNLTSLVCFGLIIVSLWKADS